MCERVYDYLFGYSHISVFFVSLRSMIKFLGYDKNLALSFFSIRNFFVFFNSKTYVLVHTKYNIIIFANFYRLIIAFIGFINIYRPVILMPWGVTLYNQNNKNTL